MLVQHSHITINNKEKQEGKISKQAFKQVDYASKQDNPNRT
jgi:hypothetical protein